MSAAEVYKELPLYSQTIKDTPLVFGIFDGMGGEECGEIASLIAAKKAVDYFRAKNIATEAERYCVEANKELCNYMKENLIRSMGTTVAMLIFSKKEITLCNIGDSKVFHFFNSRVEQLSQDHLGIAAYGSKPPLDQYLGIPHEELILAPHIKTYSYGDGDVFILCSDGLSDMLTTEDMAEILISTAFENVAEKLLKCALERGGKDNITVILCKIEKKHYGLQKILSYIRKKNNYADR